MCKREKMKITGMFIRGYDKDAVPAGLKRNKIITWGRNSLKDFIDNI